MNKKYSSYNRKPEKRKPRCKGKPRRYHRYSKRADAITLTRSKQETVMAESNESQWINIADIMSALMMIFMFIAIAFLYQILNEKEIYKVQLNKALHKEFVRRP